MILKQGVQRTVISMGFENFYSRYVSVTLNPSLEAEKEYLSKVVVLLKAPLRKCIQWTNGSSVCTSNMSTMPLVFASFEKLEPF